MRYRAFLSYSHADEGAARRLHRRLESYRLPVGLDPTVEVEGLNDRRLAPVFRDRDELVAASDLAGEIRVALESSAALIVVASPASARSRYVNQEIEEFLSLPDQRPVFVYVVGGEPGTTPDDPRSCVPPAVRAATSAEPIAADARPDKDGRTLAFLKIAAPLFGVGLGDLRDREARRRASDALPPRRGPSAAGPVVDRGPQGPEFRQDRSGRARC